MLVLFLLLRIVGKGLSHLSGEFTFAQFCRIAVTQSLPDSGHKVVTSTDAAAGIFFDFQSLVT
jgi:hypothetical protein